MKLEKMTASSSIITTKTNIDVACYLLTKIKFSYALQATLAGVVLERLFDQAQERSELEMLHEHTEQNTQSLLDYDGNTLKRKTFCIAGHLVRNYGKLSDDSEKEKDISTEYLIELNRSSLHVSTLLIIFFVLST